MNIIEISYIVCVCVSSVFFCGICLQGIKEKNEKLPEHKKIKFPNFLSNSFKNAKEPLIDSQELIPMKDTAENITDQEDIRIVLRQ